VATNVDSPRPTDRKSTQRERLLDGMIAAAHRYGYGGASVSQVIAHAGVSRPTFYEYFTDKEDCFLAAHRAHARLLVKDISRAVAAERPERAVQTAVRRFIELAEEHPDRAGFLADATMAGGWRALDERDRMIADISEVIERTRAQASPQTLTPDLPVQVVLGAVRWVLAPLLRRGERDLTALADDLTGWVESYEHPSGEHRWHTLEPGATLPPSPHESQISLRPPPSIPRGRSTLSKSEIARNQRDRILYATAEVATVKGYNGTTIADITAAASVDRRVFYKHFRDKQQAFLAVHELCIQQAMAVAASAFFSATNWPERAWESMRASTQFQTTHPIMAHIALVESHAVGAPAIQRVDDSRAAFTIFLQEGNQHTSHPVSQTVMEAIGGSVFEICYYQARQGQSERMSRLTCNSAYIVLAPFMGAAAANQFIDERLLEAGVQPAM
jgi:AcrR family transcriptional regulator